MKKTYRIASTGSRVTHPRSTLVGVDHIGFRLVEADLNPGESLCWRCAAPAYDPDGTLQVCPECGEDFND